MGAAYWAACVLLSWAAQQRAWVRARMALPPVLTIAVMLLAATLIHLDRFHHDLYGRFWVGVDFIVSPLLVYLIWVQTRGPQAAVAVARPVPAWLPLALVVQASALLIFGVLLFADPEGLESIWLWPVTPLTGRAIGAFLCGFGVAAWFAVRENNLDRLYGPALAWGARSARAGRRRPARRRPHRERPGDRALSRLLRLGTRPRRIRHAGGTSRLTGLSARPAPAPS